MGNYAGVDWAIEKHDVLVEDEGLSCRVGGESSVREVDVDAGAAEVDHRDQGVG